MKPAEHPAKSVMARRWEERRAEANARWDQTSSVVLERTSLREASPTAANPVTTEVPATPNVLADLQQLELKTAANSSGARAWLGNTQRAMLLVVLVSNGVLLALLWGGGFLE